MNLQSNHPKDYWKYIGSLGVKQERSVHIPWEVSLEDGTVTNDRDLVLGKWRSDFESLHNPEIDVEPQDTPPPDGISGQQPPTGGNTDQPAEHMEILESDITRLEVLKALFKAKSGKAIGYDGIPTEVLRNDTAISYLHTLFNKCFQSGLAPAIWSKGIINPIPKGSSSNPCDPLSYRGITHSL